MRVLVLGGSWMLGRLIVEMSLRRGFEVTVFNRRGRRDAVHPRLRHLCGDRARVEDLRELAKHGPWEAVIDISGKVPALVQRSAWALADVVERYVSVSAVSAYRDWPQQAVDEASPLLVGDPNFDPGPNGWSLEDYGFMKAGCEKACREALDPARVLIVRLHAMIGQHEDRDALQWWLDRVRRGGPILVPSPDRAFQAIDVRDVAQFIVTQIESRVVGAFNVAAPAAERTFGAMLNACVDAVAADARATPKLIWADERWLVRQGVREWTQLPLWQVAEGTWKVDVTRSVRAGLSCRALAATVADTWNWFKDARRRSASRRFLAYGIEPDREEELIAAWQRGR